MLIKTENSYGYWWFYYNCVFLLVIFCSNYTNTHVFIYVCVYFTFSTVYDFKEQKWPENFKKNIKMIQN